MTKKIVGASIGNCVHVAGIVHFLDLASQEGYETIYLGPAVELKTLFENIQKYKPQMIDIGYRLTPENVIPLLDEITQEAQKLDYEPVWVFGGTKPVADIARNYKLFSFVSDGYDDINDAIAFLRGKHASKGQEEYADNVIERIRANHPYPILRHHFGLPSLEDTIQGIKEIAQAKILDVISIGPDQNAQQYFFHPEAMKAEYNGAGGVPVRTREDFIALKEASKCGNHPLMRCYSGTEDVFEYADMLVDTIDNAWSAIPLYWYNEMDGRGTRSIEKSLEEAQRLIGWHAQRHIPVEINEPHHWALRDAHDAMTVAAAYISAYNAKKCGVEHYIAQYMFNVPHGLQFSMDLARVLAMIEIVEALKSDTFHVYRETRAGLPLFSADEAVAKGQLAASTFMQMAVKPHIIHVVAYCEADHAAAAADVIESCRIVKGVIRHTLNDSFSIEADKRVTERKNKLLQEARYLLNFVCKEYHQHQDPLANPMVLADCVKRGIFDAVHIVKNEKFKGNLHTRILDGCCDAIDTATGKCISEEERLGRIIAGEKQ